MDYWFRIVVYKRLLSFPFFPHLRFRLNRFSDNSSFLIIPRFRYFIHRGGWLHFRPSPRTTIHNHHSSELDIAHKRFVRTVQFPSVRSDTFSTVQCRKRGFIAIKYFIFFLNIALKFEPKHLTLNYDGGCVRILFTNIIHLRFCFSFYSSENHFYLFIFFVLLFY